MDSAQSPEQPSSPSSNQTPTEGRFLVNAVIGAVASVLLGFIPLSPILGGALAGYLQGGSRGDGLKVGAASGLVGLVPALLIGGLFAVVTIFGGAGARGFVVFLLFVAVAVLLVGAYMVGLGAAGGWLGIYARERREGRSADSTKSTRTDTETADVDRSSTRPDADS